MADETTETTTTTEPDDAAIEAEVNELTASPADQQADKVKNALIAAKRELRDKKRRLAEVEPIAARTAEVSEQLRRVSPLLGAVNANPKLLAEAMRIVNGTAPSRTDTAQPTDDAEAVAMAEDLGFYLADGVTPDAARGKRVLDRVGGLSRRQTEDLMRPLAGVTLGQKAETNIRAAMQETDDEGTPLATAESIREVAAQLPPQLLADPKVVDLVLNSAIGIDRRKKRTPKSPDEPMYLASTSGRRSAAPAFSAEERRAFAAVGLTEDDLKKTTAKLEKANGKAVVLGS